MNANMGPGTVLASRRDPAAMHKWYSSAFARFAAPSPRLPPPIHTQY